MRGLFSAGTGENKMDRVVRGENEEGKIIALQIVLGTALFQR